MLDNRSYIRETEERKLHIWSDNGYLGGNYCKSIAKKSDIQSIYYIKILNFIETETDESVVQRQLNVLCKRCFKELIGEE